MKKHPFDGAHRCYAASDRFVLPPTASNRLTTVLVRSSPALNARCYIAEQCTHQVLLRRVAEELLAPGGAASVLHTHGSKVFMSMTCMRVPAHARYQVMT